MDCLAPPLNAVLHIQLQIKNGLSVRSAIQSYVKNFPECSFSAQVGLWLFCLSTGKSFPLPVNKSYRNTLLNILHRGLKGAPILCLLQELEEELKIVTLQDLERQIQTLPFISLVPLFLFQVPAVFLLLLAPFVFRVTSQPEFLKSKPFFMEARTDFVNLMPYFLVGKV